MFFPRNSSNEENTGYITSSGDTHASPWRDGCTFTLSSSSLLLLLCLCAPPCSYANVKKCSNEGRALMQLDFQQFLMKLEKLTDLRPIPDKEFVETYIKAYYLTENDMEQFIKNHRVRRRDRLVLCRDKCHLLVCFSDWLLFCAGVLHEAASQPGECLPGLAYKQEGSTKTSGGHRWHRQTQEIEWWQDPERISQPQKCILPTEEAPRGELRVECLYVGAFMLWWYMQTYSFCIHVFKSHLYQMLNICSSVLTWSETQTSS